MNRYRIVAGATIATFTALLWLGGEDVSADWVRFVSLTIFVAVGFEAIYEKWLWAVLPIGRRRRPDLRGIWKGTLSTHWVDPETDKPPPPKDCYLLIGQTASTIRASLLTDESKSESSAAELAENGVGVALEYLYRNQPQIRVDNRSAAHRGAVALDIDSVARQLEGHYWTDRNSRGELTFSKKRNERVATFTEASKLEW